MQRCLILGIDQPVAQLVASQLTNMEVIGFSEKPMPALPFKQFNGDARKAASYLDAIEGIDLIYSDYIGMDVDWKLEAVFEALRQQQQQVRTVMRAVAGIDQEVTTPLEYPGIDDVTEYLKQQRYAVKIIDEAEMPYTILRPIVAKQGTDAVQLINEGLPVPNQPIDEQALANVAVDELVNGRHINQSIAVVGQS